MAKNRVIYQSEAVYVGPSISGGAYPYETIGGSGYFSVQQLYRVQSTNYSYNIDRTDVNQYSQLAAIDRVILNPPTVNFEMSYYVNGLLNEQRMGWIVNTGGNLTSNLLGAFNNFLNATYEPRDYFVLTGPEGSDVNANSSLFTEAYKNSMYGFGNMVPTNYSVRAAVNDFPSASVTLEGMNMNFIRLGESAGDTYGTWNGGVGLVTQVPSIKEDGTSSLPSNLNFVPFPIPPQSSYTGTPVGFPANFYTVSVLRPGDISFTFKNTQTSTDAVITGAANLTEIKIQSFNLSVGISRDSVQKLGKKYPVVRPIRFPMNAALSVEAYVGDIVTGNLYNVLTTDVGYDCEIKLRHPLIANTSSCSYILRNLKLDSQNVNSSIGSNKTVTLNFTTTINGSNTASKADGLYFVVYPEH